MNFGKLLSLAAALAALSAAVAVCVVAAAFAVYALARDALGPAGAAAVVAAVFAVLSAILALVLARKAQPPQRAHETPAGDRSLTSWLIELAKERPLVAAGAGIAAATVVLRNPGILSAVLSAAIAGRAAKPDK